MLIRDVIDEILQSETPNKRVGTQEMHKIYLGQLRVELGSRSIATFTRKEYMMWIAKYRNARSADRETFDDYTKFLNIISNYSYQHGYISNLIKYPCTDNSDRDHTGRVYTNAELKRMWDTSADDVVIRLQLVLALECFFRLREALLLTWDRVDLDDRKVILRKQDVKTGSKMGKGRVVPLSNNAFQMLTELKKTATTKWVFPNPKKNGPVDKNDKRWAKIKRLSGIKGRARWHDLRHTALTIAATQKNVNLANLAIVAGVSVLTIQRVYLHAHVEDLRDVTKSIDIKKIA